MIPRGNPRVGGAVSNIGITLHSRSFGQITLRRKANMSLQVECNCGKAYRISEDLIGKSMRCRECGEVIVVRNANDEADKPLARRRRSSGQSARRKARSQSRKLVIGASVAGFMLICLLAVMFLKRDHERTGAKQVPGIADPAGATTTGTATSSGSDVVNVPFKPSIFPQMPNSVETDVAGGFYPALLEAGTNKQSLRRHQPDPLAALQEQFSDLKVLELTPHPAWNSPIDRRNEIKETFVPKAIELQCEGESELDLAVVSVSEKPRLVVPTFEVNQSAKKPPTELHVFDLPANGKPDRVVKLPSYGKLISVSPAGTRAAVLVDFNQHPDPANRVLFDVSGLYLANLTSGEVEEWRPLPRAQISDFIFVDETHAFTTIECLVLWDLVARKPDYVIKNMQQMGQPACLALSPNRQFIAARTLSHHREQSGVWLLDVKTGAELGYLKINGQPQTAMFSRTGDFLAVGYTNRHSCGVALWHLPDGKLVCDLPVPRVPKLSGWAGENFLMTDLGVLDLSRGGIIAGCSVPLAQTLDSRQWFLKNNGFGKPPTLVSGVLSTKPFIDATASVNPLDQIVLRHGETISVKFEIASPNREATEKQFLELLTTIGMSVAPNQPKTLVVKYSDQATGKTSNVTVVKKVGDLFREGAGTQQQLSEREYSISMQLLQNNSIVWELSTTGKTSIPLLTGSAEGIAKSHQSGFGTGMLMNSAFSSVVFRNNWTENMSQWECTSSNGFQPFVSKPDVIPKRRRK